MKGIFSRNHIYKGILFVLLTTVLAISATQAHAQADSTTADGLYTLAREAAFNDKDYPRAIAYSHRALAITPEYTDILVFLGRIHSWNKATDSARYYLNKALAQDATYEQAYTALANLEYWNDNDSTALDIANKGLSYHPQSTSLLLQKAKILTDFRDYQNAAIITDSILSIDRGNTEARALSQLIKDNISFNSIGIHYDYVTFDKQFEDPWHFARVFYTRNTRLGSITFNVNYANRFRQDGWQYELEAYPRISKTFYAYVNLGYSADVPVFPEWRGGASLYANLPKSYEAELGFRYLYFTSSTTIYTAYLGKYISSFLFGARTYLNPNGNSTSQTYNILARYYYGGANDFIGLTLGYGISPDDRSIAYQVYDSKSYRAILEFKKAFSRLNILSLNASLLNQEYRPETKGNQFQLGIGYTRRF